MSSTSKYLDQLFISKVRIKALRYFFSNPQQRIHLRGAVRELNEEINAVRRELARMEAIHLLHAERYGNKKYFKLNPSFIYYDELLGMIHKSFGLGGEIISNIKNLGEIHFSLLTQKYTKGIGIGTHEIDLLFIGENLNMHLIDEIVSKQEKKLHREIVYTVMTPREFELRKGRKDSFIRELFMQDRVMLIGSSIDFMLMK